MAAAATSSTSAGQRMSRYHRTSGISLVVGQMGMIDVSGDEDDDDDNGEHEGIVSTCSDDAAPGSVNTSINDIAKQLRFRNKCGFESTDSTPKRSSHRTFPYPTVHATPLETTSTSTIPDDLPSTGAMPSTLSNLPLPSPLATPPLSPTNTPLDLVPLIPLKHPVPVFDSCDTIRHRYLQFFQQYPSFSPSTSFAAFSIAGPSVRPSPSSYPHTNPPPSPPLPSLQSRFPELLVILSREHPQCAVLGEAGFVWFMTLQGGARQGRKSAFYYAGYVVFEKLRLAEGRRKSVKRRREEDKVRECGGWLGWVPPKREFWKLRYPA